MTFGRYAALVAALVAGGLLVARLALPNAAFPAVALGAILAGLNTVVAAYLVSWSTGKPTPAFMAAVLGGMTVRMGLMLGVVVFALEVLEMSRMPLVVSLLVSFACFLALELWLMAGRRPATAEAR